MTNKALANRQHKMTHNGDENLAETGEPLKYGQ